MGADRKHPIVDRKHPIVHLVGSIPLPDGETVIRKHVDSLPAGRARQQPGDRACRRRSAVQVHPVGRQGRARDSSPSRQAGCHARCQVVQDRLRHMAMESWSLFDRLQQAGLIPPKVKFQISIPTPIAPTYNNMVPAARPKLLAALTEVFIGEVATIARTLPNDRIALQWDVCQEVLAWEGYYEPGPVDFRTETIAVLSKIGDAVPASIELGYHLCYGSPADEHMVQPKDTGIMVEMANAITAGVKRPIDFFHMPVPKGRTDDSYFAPLEKLKLGRDTELYLGLIHHDDAQGDAARLAAARRHARVDGIGTECGMARGDPARLPALLAAHARAAELAVPR